MSDDKRKPGLPAVYELREARKAGRFARVSPGAVGWACVGLVGVMVGYNLWSTHQVNVQRQAIVSGWEQAQKTYSAPLSNTAAAIDSVFADARGPWKGESAASTPGKLDGMLYVHTTRAELSKSIYDIARDSARDSVVVCLVQNVAAGIAVESERVPNLHAFENGRAILQSSWLDKVRDEDRGVRVGLYARQFAETVASPTAPFVRVAPRADSVLLVVDEDTDGEASVYFARVGDAHVGRTRLKSESGVTDVGSHEQVDPKIWMAAKRQANGCALGRSTGRFLNALSTQPPVDGSAK